MSIIQNLRDRAAWIISGAIAFALIVFVVEEGLRNKTVFGGSQNTLGKVNGTEIERIAFEERFKTMEDRYTRMGYPMDEATRSQQREMLWNEYVEDAIMDKVYDDLGFDVTDKEVGDILFGANPPQDFAQRFTDPKTGQFDANAAYQAIQQIKKQKNSPDYKSFFGEYVPALIKLRKKEKYDALINNAVYVPKWMIEKQNAENSQIASISYVAVPYSTISDSSIKVTDADINEYVAKNKSSFKQDKSAAINYIIFSGSPSAKDSAAALQEIINLKDTFTTTSDVAQFLTSQSNQSLYYNSHISRKEIKIPVIDSILRVPTGNVYGPYIDGSSYVLAKVVSSRTVPDTVKVRHILIATMQQDPQTGQAFPVRAEDVAKKLADSISNAIKTGSNFDTLCAKFSDDGTRTSGGIYEGVVTGRMVAEFNDFIFNNPTGAKGVVKTNFGYHYVEILSQKGSGPAYKIAYVTKPILVSDETANASLGLATQFAGENRNKNSFEENAKKQGLNIFSAEDVKPLDANINGLQGNARELVRWAFNDAKEGDVTERPFTIGSDYVVAVLNHSYEEGTMTAEKARPAAEYKIRQQKKVAEITQKAGNVSNLDAVAKTFNAVVLKADSLSFANPQIANVGYEPKVVGAAFNKGNSQKVSNPVSGELGVFFIKTENLSGVANAGLDVKTQQLNQTQQLKMFSQRMLFENKKKAASITDNRYKFF